MNGTKPGCCFEIADLHASAGKLAEAEEFCRQAETLERDRIERARGREEEDDVLEELFGNVARVRADIAQSRGDLAEESRQRALAVVHAYAFQVRPPQAVPCENDPQRYEGGPDPYTDFFYREMSDRAAFRIADLIAAGQLDAAGEMARQLAACWQRQDLGETADVLRQVAGSPPGPRPEALRHALFPPPFDAQHGDLDGYIEDGLELAADVRADHAVTPHLKPRARASAVNSDSSAGRITFRLRVGVTGHRGLQTSQSWNVAIREQLGRLIDRLEHEATTTVELAVISQLAGMVVTGSWSSRCSSSAKNNSSKPGWKRCSPCRGKPTPRPRTGTPTLVRSSTRC